MPARRDPRFATTHWSMVLRAGREQSDEAQSALSRLCRIYWYPLYAHVRRRGYPPADAQDLTQQFFARLLARQLLASADPERGRFRSFLLTSLDHFLRDEWAKARAQKRGGGEVAFPVSLDLAESRFERESSSLSPDQAFDRQWAVALLGSVLQQLEDDYRREQKAALFAALQPTLTGLREHQPYAEIAAHLGLSEAAVKVAVHRLRQRYRARLQAEIAATVASDADVKDEMQHLFRTFAHGP